MRVDEAFYVLVMGEQVCCTVGEDGKTEKKEVGAVDDLLVCIED